MAERRVCDMKPIEGFCLGLRVLLALQRFERGLDLAQVLLHPAQLPCDSGGGLQHAGRHLGARGRVGPAERHGLLAVGVAFAASTRLGLQHAGPQLQQAPDDAQRELRHGMGHERPRHADLARDARRPDGVLPVQRPEPGAFEALQDLRGVLPDGLQEGVDDLLVVVLVGRPGGQQALAVRQRGSVLPLVGERLHARQRLDGDVARLVRGLLPDPARADLLGDAGLPVALETNGRLVQDLLGVEQLGQARPHARRPSLPRARRRTIGAFARPGTGGAGVRLQRRRPRACGHCRGGIGFVGLWDRFQFVVRR